MESNSTNFQSNVGSTGEKPPVTETLKEPVQQILNQGQEKATEMAGQLKNGLLASIDGQKQRAADSLDLVCEGLHEMGNRIALQGSPAIGQYLHTAHHTLERYSDYLRQSDLNDMVDDVQVFARQNPTMIVGGLFALGFLAGRFLRSSAPETKSLAIYTGDVGMEDTTIRQRPSVATTVPPVRFQEEPTWR